MRAGQLEAGRARDQGARAACAARLRTAAALASRPVTPPPLPARPTLRRRPAGFSQAYGSGLGEQLAAALEGAGFSRGAAFRLYLTGAPRPALLPAVRAHAQLSSSAGLLPAAARALPARRSAWLAQRPAGPAAALTPPALAAPCTAAQATAWAARWPCWRPTT